MKGLMDPAKVLELAERAEVYWQQRFDERKKTWIAQTAQETFGWPFKKVVGRERAESWFNASGLSNAPYYAWGGTFWVEKRFIEISNHLAHIAQGKRDIEKLILKVEELNALRPVMDTDYE